MLSPFHGRTTQRRRMPSYWPATYACLLGNLEQAGQPGHRLSTPARLKDSWTFSGTRLTIPNSFGSHTNKRTVPVCLRTCSALGFCATSNGCVFSSMASLRVSPPIAIRQCSTPGPFTGHWRRLILNTLNSISRNGPCGSALRAPTPRLNLVG
jgi:hypothetical protein